MQNPDRIREQVQQLTGSNEAKREAYEAQLAVIQERKNLAERDTMRSRALRESFTVSEQFLTQQRVMLVEQTSPAPHVLEGVDSALEEIRRLQRQATEMLMKSEGAFTALLGIEESVQQQMAATMSRIRGLEIQGAKAIGAAERLPPATGEISLMDQLNDAEAPSDTNDPMALPKQKPSKRRSEGKTEP